MKRNFLAVCVLVSLASVVQAADIKESTATVAALDTLEQKTSYLIGQNMAKNLQQNSVDLDIDAFVQALKDVKGGVSPRIAEEDAQKIMQEMQSKINAKRELKEKQESEASKAAGEAYLAKNKKKSGVKVTASGLQYKVLTTGKGEKPTGAQMITVHYTGKLVDGTVFDSSHKNGDQPLSFPLNGVIAGWTEALQMMQKGSKWEIVIPSNLAYGDSGQGPIPPSSTLIFEVELLDIKPAQP